MRQNKFLKLVTIFLLATIANVYGNVLNSKDKSLDKELQRIEQKNGSHIGLAVIDTSNNNRISYNGNKTFSMQCTAKVMGVAAILNQSRENTKLLDERVYYKGNDLVSWSPVTSKHLADGMTVKDLCKATLEYSDNTAMNLLVNKMGGLQAMNKFAKQIGNDSFRQDDMWPKEADGTPQDIKNTSTPNDMASSLQNLLFTNSLPNTQREDLKSWLKQCKTGNNRIRSGIPHGWVVGDKTGTGSYYGITNDLAVIWPPHCKPIIIGIYYYNTEKSATKNEQALGQIAKLTINELARSNSCLKSNLNLKKPS